MFLIGDVNTTQTRKISRNILKRPTLLLDVINNATKLKALKIPPVNRLKELEPPRKGIWSVRIND
jgi:plasmid maintenance system killer protein